MNTGSDLPVNEPPLGPSLKKRMLVWPVKRLGWWAVATTAVALASFFAFPLITMAYRTTYPIVDTWIMPAALAMLADAAAVLSVLAIWRERSLLGILVLVMSVPAALITTLVVLGG
jgi:hypothetical protein